MPTADRRRAEAARTKPPARARPPAPATEEVREELPPVEPPAPPAPEPELEAGPGPRDWRDIAEAPPFNVHEEGRSEHGPFELRLSGRAHDTMKGEEVVALWRRGATTSGGFGWGWRTKAGRTFGWLGVEAWRPVAESV